MDLNIFYHCAFWAVCMLGYFGFLRAEEFTVPNLASFSPATHLLVANIAVDSRQSPACLHVWIKASKTDPFCQGCHIHIGLGRAPLCTVQALLAYLSLQGNVPGPLFPLTHGQPLSRSILTDWLWQFFPTAGIEGNFSSDSFRIGAAMVAARNGIPHQLIQALGRWTNSAYRFYIRTPSEALAGISSQLAWHPVSLSLWVPFVIYSAFDIAAELSTKLTWACTAVNGVILTVSCISLASVLSCVLTQLLQLGAWSSWSWRFHFTPVRWLLPFQAPRRFRLGGGRSQGCHGYLLLLQEHCLAPPTL